MGIEITFVKDGKKSKFENSILIIQVIISVITIGTIFYGLDSYKFEKKVDSTNVFLSKFGTSIHDYESFLYSEFFKAYIPITNTGVLSHLPLYKINEIQITNNQNYIVFKNYLKLSGDYKEVEKFNNLDIRYNKIQDNFAIIGEEMYDEMINEGSGFTNFSSGLLFKKDTLNKEIYKFSDDIIDTIK